MSYGKGDKIIAAVFNMSLSLGLLISSFCVHETSAMQLMAGSYYPALILSGKSLVISYDHSSTYI